MNHHGYLANTAVLDVVDEDKLAPCWTPTRLFAVSYTHLTLPTIYSV